jgi:DNA-directed RNA polymerase subunit alpha
MAQNPMDMVIGAEEAQRDSKAAAKHLEAARAAEKAGDFDKQVAELRRGLAADPANNAVIFELAYRLDLMGEEDEAIALYEQACDQVPAPVNALLNLAVLYEDRGENGRAERCLRQILETNPNHPRARLYMKDVQASREMSVEMRASGMCSSGVRCWTRP